MSDETIRVLLFSGDRTVREQVRLALGRKVAADLPSIEIEEVATGPALLRMLDADTGYGLVIMDGEAQHSQQLRCVSWLPWPPSRCSKRGVP